MASATAAGRSSRGRGRLAELDDPHGLSDNSSILSGGGGGGGYGATQPVVYEQIIHRPARVEPKVFLANERTLFHWLNLAVVLTTVAVGFLNSSLPGAAWLAVLFTAVAGGMMLYALRYYYWRIDRIRYRDISDYSDRYGPAVMAVILLSALLFALAIWLNEP